MSYNNSFLGRESVWYAIEQYGEIQTKTLACAVANGLSVMMHT